MSKSSDYFEEDRASQLRSRTEEYKTKRNDKLEEFYKQLLVEITYQIDSWWRNHDPLNNRTFFRKNYHSIIIHKTFSKPDLDISNDDVIEQWSIANLKPYIIYGFKVHLGGHGKDNITLSIRWD